MNLNRFQFETAEGRTPTISAVFPVPPKILTMSLTVFMLRIYVQPD
jgi:hypothetical protein